jgi:hypothetical protein
MSSVFIIFAKHFGGQEKVILIFEFMKFRSKKFWIKFQKVLDYHLKFRPSASGGCAMGLFPVQRKNSYKEKEEKMGQINTMNTNSKRREDLRLAT